MIKKERIQFLFVIILIMLSRIPFLFYGYGSEEDAWALPLVAQRIGTTFQYEVSRMPGHPFQEMFYALIWNSGSFVFNLITLLISTAGIACFMLFLKELKIRQWLWAGIALAITPVVYINCTNDMDYCWAMGFTLVSFFLALKNKPVPSGLFLALAIGCRITSGAMLLPLLMLLFFTSDASIRIKQCIKLIISSALFTFLIFIPVFQVYGTSFFMYYEHFPIPGFAKNFYKGVIAVWGIIGVFGLCAAAVFILSKRKIYEPAVLKNTNISKQILLICVLIIILYSISFAKMPLKSAFMIPLVPFVWMALSIYVPFRLYRALVLLMLASTFSFGINLSDPLRGSKESIFSIQKNIGGQKIAVDPFNGLLIADITKRQQRTDYTMKILNETSVIKKPTFIIAGWWFADLLVLQRGRENKEVIFAYYTDEPELLKYQKAGYEIFYLPEQDVFNDLRFKKTFTYRYAKEFVNADLTDR